MPKRRLPSPRVLRRLIDYSPETGELRWKERPAWMFKAGYRPRSANAGTWNCRYANKPAFTHSMPKGYKHGALLNISMRAHRVIWAIHHGAWPEGQIDHINGITDDNRIDNLRLVQPVDNQRNMSRARNNTSGVTGVHFHHPSGLWYARITVNYKEKYLGCYSDFEDVVAARKQAEIDYNFHSNHGRENPNK